MLPVPGVRLRFAFPCVFLHNGCWVRNHTGNPAAVRLEDRGGCGLGLELGFELGLGLDRLLEKSVFWDSNTVQLGLVLGLVLG